MCPTTRPISAGGVLYVIAKNATNVTTTGDGTAATAGAGIAISRVTTNTAAYIDSHSSRGVDAGSLVVAADSNNTVVTVATASPGGSTAEQLLPERQHLDRVAPGWLRERAGRRRSASPARSPSPSLTQKTTAYIAPVGGAPRDRGVEHERADGRVARRSRSTRDRPAAATSSADGSAVGGGSAGVGTAVSVNVADVDTSSYVGNVSITAAKVAVEAIGAAADERRREHVRCDLDVGAGGSASVGVAGSLAVNVVTLNTVASVAPGGTVAVTGGRPGDRGPLQQRQRGEGPARRRRRHDRRHRGDRRTQHRQRHDERRIQDGVDAERSARPCAALGRGRAGDDRGARWGHVARHRDRPGHRDHDVERDHDVGRRHRSTARADRLVLGAANEQASATTTATGEVNAAGAAVGIAIALTFATHVVQATTLRDLTAAGDASFTAIGASATSTTASASATGAPGDGNQPTPGSQITEARAFADNAAPTTGGALPGGGGGSGPGSTPPEPSTPAGTGHRRGRARADRAHMRPPIRRSAESRSRPASSSLTATLNDSATSTATGAPSHPRATGPTTIAAAIAITVADASVRANVGPEPTIHAKALTLSAGVNPTDANGVADSTDRFTTTATAGAGGGGTLGVAGSVAVSTVTLSTSASLLRAQDQPPP